MKSQTKKFIVAIFGTKRDGRKEERVLYQSPVFFTETAQDAEGKAFAFFLKQYPGYKIEMHISTEI